MSVSPNDWQNIHRAFLDRALDPDEDDQIWYLLQEDLGTDLVYRADPKRRGHGFIEPARKMALHQYEQALAATRASWRLYSVEKRDQQ